MRDEAPAWADWAEATTTPTRGLGDGPGFGPVGKQRSTLLTIVLFVLTLSFSSLYWFAVVHRELRRHSGVGLGGTLAFVVTFFFFPVMPFLTSSEIGAVRSRAGRPAQVSGLTGLWVVPGALLLVLPLVWFVRTNRALNDYWAGFGATSGR
jgi:Domain of unknown function (DUF4234)